MNFGPLVSIITVCYNSEKTISRTIESVLEQTYDNIEYLIIDGKSIDTTVEIAQSYKSLFSQRGYDYKIFSESDEGIYDAMNKGVRRSTGELIGIINSDDWYEPIAVREMVRSYEREKFDVFYADLRIHRKSGSFIKKARIKKIASTRHWNHPTTFITKNTYLNMLYSLETGVYADWDLILKLRKSKKKFVILNKVLANFSFGGVSNQKSLKLSIERLFLRFNIYRSNGYSKLYIFDCVLIELAKYFAA